MKVYQLYMPAELHQKIKEASLAKKVTMNDFILVVLQKHLKQKGVN